MEQLPIEVLRRIPPLLPSSGDVSRLMRSGPRQLYTIGGEFLYSNIRLTMGATRPTRYASSVVGRVHGRRMLELLSSQEPRHALDHPAGWIRHLVVVWPLFANDEEEGQRLLLRALSLADGLLSLELQGVSPPAWNNLLHDSAGSSLFLPRLEALKTDSMQDSICLAEFRQLESVYVTSWSSSAELQDLILALNSRNTQSTMKQLQLSLKIDGLEDVNATLSHISTAFPDLSVLCVEFDLGLEFPERPLSWSRIHTISAEAGVVLSALRRLHTFSTTIFPEPARDVPENIKALELLSEHCYTLRHTELRWHRKDGAKYSPVQDRGGLIRGQWAYSRAAT